MAGACLGHAWLAQIRHMSLPETHVVVLYDQPGHPRLLLYIGILCMLTCADTMMLLQQALRSVLEAKQVDYDFEFYKLPMPLDVPVTILSQGRALLQGSVDAVLPLQSTSAAGSCLNPAAYMSLL